MYSYPITQKQLELIKSGNTTIADEILEIMAKTDIDSIMDAVGNEGLKIKEKIIAIIEDKKYNMADIPETISIAMSIKNIISNLSEMKGEITDIDINEIIVLLSSTLLLIKQEAF